MAGADAGALTDPLVGGFHHLSQVVVGELALGKVGRPTGDSAVGHGVLRHGHETAGGDRLVGRLVKDCRKLGEKGCGRSRDRVECPCRTTNSPDS